MSIKELSKKEEQAKALEEVREELSKKEKELATMNEMKAMRPKGEGVGGGEGEVELKKNLKKFKYLTDFP